MDEIQGNTSVILINGDFIEDYPRAFPPMVVKVPGLHVQVRNGLKNGPLEKVQRISTNFFDMDI